MTRQGLALVLVGVLTSATATASLAQEKPPRPSAIRNDTTAPRVVADVPSATNAYTVNFTSTYSDDVELAYVRTGSSSPFVFMPQGVRTYTIDEAVSVPLGPPMTRTLMAIDTSGNVGKKTFTITPLDSAFRVGTYAIIGTNTFPSGFDCSAGVLWTPPNQPPPLFSQTVATLRVSAGIWSSDTGFTPTFAWTTSGNSGGPPFLAQAMPLSSTAFDGESMSSMSVGTGYSYQSKMLLAARVIQDAPRRISYSLTMSCNINNAGWVNGPTAVFVGEFQKY